MLRTPRSFQQAVPLWKYNSICLPRRQQIVPKGSQRQCQLEVGSPRGSEKEGGRAGSTRAEEEERCQESGGRRARGREAGERGEMSTDRMKRSEGPFIGEGRVEELGPEMEKRTEEEQTGRAKRREKRRGVETEVIGRNKGNRPGERGNRQREGRPEERHLGREQ
ncbi:hypothetical protein NDU88_002259 [Pleurodeles waltl]|uniref:Uncharacterized protein n=1 Tax=Pleurodeles waltl TaxID=8319 RepID=A0AAV7LBU0_PLEWA|nr:hypothetical protein NDU88_002259 [Pleurodeles waltl]